MANRLAYGELLHPDGQQVAQVEYPRYLAIWLYRNPDLLAAAFDLTCTHCGGFGRLSWHYCDWCDGDGCLTPKMMRAQLVKRYQEQKFQDRARLRSYLQAVAV